MFGAAFGHPHGLAFDPSGNMFVANPSSGVGHEGIFKVAAVIPPPGPVVTHLEACGVLTEPGEYALDNDVFPVGDADCFTISGSDITLDGSGHKIVQDPGSSNNAVLVGDSATNLPANGVTVKNLRIERTHKGAGIVIWNPSNVTITNNTVLNRFGDQLGTGMLLSDAIDSVITGNTFSGNNWGPFVRATSVGNEIYSNNFIGNNGGAGAIDGISGNVFDLPMPVGGNHWSNFNESGEGCTDANGDGICDGPFVFDGGQDNLPWTSPDGWLSPIPDTDGDGIHDPVDTDDDNDGIADVIDPQPLVGSSLFDDSGLGGSTSGSVSGSLTVNDASDPPRSVRAVAQRHFRWLTETHWSSPVAVPFLRCCLGPWTPPWWQMTVP